MFTDIESVDTQIFGFFAPNDLVKLGLVCKKSYKISKNPVYWQSFLLPEFSKKADPECYKRVFIDFPEYRKRLFLEVDQKGRLYALFKEILIPEYCRTHLDFKSLIPFDQVLKRLSPHQSLSLKSDYVDSSQSVIPDKQAIEILIEKEILFKENVQKLNSEQLRKLSLLKDFILQKKLLFYVAMNLDNSKINKIVSISDLILNDHIKIMRAFSFSDQKIKILKHLTLFIQQGDIEIDNLFYDDIAYFACEYLGELLAQKIVIAADALPIIRLFQNKNHVDSISSLNGKISESI